MTNSKAKASQGESLPVNGKADLYRLKANLNRLTETDWQALMITNPEIVEAIKKLNATF